MLLHSGLENKSAAGQKAVAKILESFLFSAGVILFAGALLAGVQWFAATLGGLMYENQPAPAAFSKQFEVSASSEQIPAPQTVSAAPAVTVDDGKVHAQAFLSAKADLGQLTALLAEQPEKQLPVASLTKLMTALVVLEKYDLSHKVIMSESAMKQEGDQGDLKAGQTLSVKNLLFIMLMESSNRAAQRLAEMMGVQDFIAAMNSRAQELGLANTRFADATGLSAGSYSTASDVAALTAHLFSHFPLFSEITGYKEFRLYADGRFHHTLINTNKFLGEYDIISGKTGWTNEARGCFVVVQKNAQSGYVINVILGAEDRFLEMQKLIKSIQ